MYFKPNQTKVSHIFYKTNRTFANDWFRALPRTNACGKHAALAVAALTTQ